MYSIYRSLLYLIVLGSIVNGLKELPTYFPRCKRTDPKFEECLLKATEEVRPYIRKGVPDFLPGFQSFTVPEIVLEQGTRSVNFKAYLKNLTLLGLDGYHFTRYEFVVKNLTFFIEVELPYLFMEGKYKIDGKLLFAPIKGDGNFHFNITDSLCSIYHEVTVVSINGTDYLKPSVTVPKMRVGKIIDYSFEGLFKENKDLAEAANNVIKDNLHLIVEDITPAIEKVLAAIFNDTIFKSVTQIPYDKLYPK